jgi:hypothetical protein
LIGYWDKFCFWLSFLLLSKTGFDYRPFRITRQCTRCNRDDIQPRQPTSCVNRNSKVDRIGSDLTFDELRGLGKRVPPMTNVRDSPSTTSLQSSENVEHRVTRCSASSHRIPVSARHGERSLRIEINGRTRGRSTDEHYSWCHSRRAVATFQCKINSGARYLALEGYTFMSTLLHSVTCPMALPANVIVACSRAPGTIIGAMAMCTSSRQHRQPTDIQWTPDIPSA